MSGKVQVLEVPYETPYIRDTSPLVSFVLTLTSVHIVVTCSSSHQLGVLNCFGPQQPLVCRV